jgi:hypothetical protein
MKTRSITYCGNIESLNAGVVGTIGSKDTPFVR